MARTLVEAFEIAAAQHLTAPAIGWRDTQWSFGDLQQCVRAATARVLATGIPRGARVALLMRNSPQYVALYYGVLAAGCAAVPLNAQERASVLLRQIHHCGASLLMGDPEHPEWSALAGSDAIPAVAVQVHSDATSADTFIAALGGHQSASLTSETTALASIIYTSGTTGQPKGVMLSHGNLYSNTRAIIDYLELTSNDRGLCVLPFHFSYGNSVLNTHLLSGAYLGLEDNFAFPQATLQRLQDDAITGFAGVPSTFALLLGRCRLSDFDLSNLRYITQAGGPMPRAMIERLREQVPAVRVFIMYGQTEATARLTYLPPERLHEKLGSIGVPIAGVEIDVRSEGRTVVAGQPGELFARGPNVMLGYWDNPAATSAVLQDGWLKTGDLGYCDEDGYLYLTGRAVDMIKVGAFRVSPQEVEEVLAALDGVQEVAVTGIPDEMLGQSIKAVIVPRPDAALEILAVKAHCRQHLAAYKIPKLVEFAASLPRTSSGKVQRFKLAQEKQHI